jgi:hypothetical protein
VRTYVPFVNRKYRGVEANLTNVRGKLPADLNINSVLCIRTERNVKKDSTVVLDGKLYLIEAECSSKKILFEKHLDGSLQIISKVGASSVRRLQRGPKLYKSKQCVAENLLSHRNILRGEKRLTEAASQKKIQSLLISKRGHFTFYCNRQWCFVRIPHLKSGHTCSPS